MIKRLKFIFKLNTENKKNYLIAFVFILFIWYQMISFNEKYIGVFRTGYDFFIYVLSDYLSITFVFTAGYILYIFNLRKSVRLKKCLVLKYTSRLKYYKNFIIIIFISSFIFIGAIVAICGIFSAVKFPFKNQWSEFFKIYFNVSNDNNLLTMMKKILPSTAILLNILFLFLYFNLIGMIIFVVSTLFNQGFITTILAYSPSVLSQAVEIKGLVKYNSYAVHYNTAITWHSFTAVDEKPTILFSFVYWIILNLIFILIGIYIYKTKEIKTEEGEVNIL
ncbi:MAG: hypothetical protein KID00_04545 [Clostridium argentinense]|uniref:ABC-2 family transporter protein n=1 Tax=Clostridium faecium TaxID=2762223 RepID=A0ABR8YQ77_9CLOT|nr:MULTISPECIES: hypothetical protein [Clostridium]MBD8046412.1 hypothetical protein [Clostridium faecium]MBS5823123.1 hypothetical protein [Clostridium argentinense]MDU1350376.1 hypothetical protein [Clostridium argentinense]